VGSNELARCAGVSVAELTHPLDERVGSEIADLFGVPVAALYAFINGGPHAAIEGPLGDIILLRRFAVGQEISPSESFFVCSSRRGSDAHV
jgi:hypothetical protein